MIKIGTGPSATKASGDEFVQAAESALFTGDLGRVSDAELARVMTAAMRLYAAKADVVGKKPVPVEPEKLTPTDVVVTVTETIRAVGLNLWDLSMWVQRPS
jgi:hypothetical protein